MLELNLYPIAEDQPENAKELYKKSCRSYNRKYDI